jgi:glycosyltransferase involved in cell wall biosynthesis
MAGPAIRAAELCARLAARAQVTLACPGASELRATPFSTREHAPSESLRPLLHDLREGDAFVAQGFGFPLRDAFTLPDGVRLVLDLYDPVQLELLARYGSSPQPEERLHLALVRRRLLALLGRADHVLCASERQRAFWLGWLGAAGRLTPDALADDPQAQRLLALVPFGVAADGEPREARSEKPFGDLVRAGERPILWWGGLWDWMDPVTAVRAVARLRDGGAPAVLVLPAANRPGAAPMPAARAAEEEARARGLWGPGNGVVQLPQWLPYAERRVVLEGAAVALSCHRPSLEAELAFRTRLLDCLWASLPAVATAGDELSARAEREGWGLAAPAGDAEAVAAALRALLDRQRNTAAREAAARVRAQYSWDRSAEALARLLEGPSPRRAAAPGWGPAALLAPELSGALPLDVARAAARKLAGKVRRKPEGG